MLKDGFTSVQMIYLADEVKRKLEKLEETIKEPEFDKYKNEFFTYWISMEGSYALKKFSEFDIRSDSGNFYPVRGDDKRLSELKSKQYLSADKALNELRSVKGLDPLSEEDTFYFLVLYKLVVQLSHSDGGSSEWYDSTYYLNKLEEVPIKEFFSKINPGLVKDYKELGYVLLKIVGGMLAQEDNYYAFYKATEHIAFELGWDRPVSFIELFVRVKLPELFNSLNDDDEFFFELENNPRALFEPKRSDFEEFNKVAKLQDYNNLKENLIHKQQPDNLGAKAAASVIWALNEWQPESISKSEKGVEEGIKTFSISSNAKPTTIWKHVRNTGKANKHDPLDATNLYAAAEWLKKEGYKKAAAEAYKLCAEQRQG